MNTKDENKQINCYLVRWYDKGYGPFSLYTPWWISGYDFDNNTVFLAAIKAYSTDHVREIIYGCYDEKPDEIEFSFIGEKEDGWEGPTFDRFSWEDWMRMYWNRGVYRQEE